METEHDLLLSKRLHLLKLSADTFGPLYSKNVHISKMEA